MHNSLCSQAEDPSIFWFGIGYSSSCEGRGEYLADCYNPRREETDSLVTRLFSQTELDPSILDRYMEVTYTTEPGNHIQAEKTYLIGWAGRPAGQ